MLAAFAYNRRLPVDGAADRPHGVVAVYSLALATALMMGLRYEVGGDWSAYLENYDLIQLLSFSQAIGTLDVGYAAIVFVAGRLEAGMALVNLACALIMTLGMARFCLRQPNPALSFLVGVPYLVIVVGMGYTRQGVAIGLILAALADADERSTLRLVLFIAAAALFHRTALLILPLVLLPIARRNLLYTIAGVASFAGLFVLLLGGSTDQLLNNYVSANYESSGAAVRVAMNIVPAVVALAFRRRLGLGTYQRDVWSVFAIVSLAIFPLVLTASYTTAIDRLALFLIPLQVAILPRIPYAFGRDPDGFGHSSRSNPELLLAVIGYSAAVQLVWLVFSVHSIYWIPYATYLSARY